MCFRFTGDHIFRADFVVAENVTKYVASKKNTCVMNVKKEIIAMCYIVIIIHICITVQLRYFGRARFVAQLIFKIDFVFI